VENLPPDGPKGRYLTDRLTDEAVRLIGEGSDKPFFLYFSYYSVHTPIQPRPDLRDRYAKQLKPGKLHKNASYAAMVAAVDESVGRVMKQLEDIGQADNTIIVFTSDNGGMHKVTTNAPLRGGKGMAWEGGTRVPLIIKTPGMTSAGQTCREPVISIDFYPTLLELSGTAGDTTHNANVDGLSLTPLLHNPTGTLKREAIYWHYPHYNVLLGVPHSSLRSGRYKLIEFYEGNRLELYDLETDLGEQSNLVTEFPAKSRALRKQLHTWRNRVGAQSPSPR
jgi:arylsulfatase A